MKKKINLLVLSVIFIGTFIAKSESVEDVDYFESGSNYYCYPWLEVAPPALTPSPQGFVPFHIEHYGRHGSRWLIGDNSYETSYALLKKAKEANKLTPLGEEVFEVVENATQEFRRGRDGELSDKGAIQHQGIGKRMVQNFPELFTSETNIDARSTVVIRCILSMLNGLKGIQSIVPDINVKTDASHADMWYMNYWDPVQNSLKHRVDSLQYKDFQLAHANKGEYLKNLINDEDYARDSIGTALFNPLFSLLVNTQSHYTQPWIIEKVFSPEEVRNRWIIKNANWFLQSGNSRLTDNHQPLSQKNLLLNIIESADTAIVTPSQSVNLRYGHDSVVMPLTCLLELNGYGEEINDLEELAVKGWHDYKVIPMGGNIQIVFYRPEKAVYNPEEVLVKVLLNEEEAVLPLPSENQPYYKWTDFKTYYLDKLK